MEAEQTSLSFEQFLGVLRRRALWVAMCVVLAAGIAYGYSKHKTKQYTATASVTFSNLTPDTYTFTAQAFSASGPGFGTAVSTTLVLTTREVMGMARF